MAALLEVMAVQLQQWEYVHREWTTAARQAVIDLAIVIAERLLRQSIADDSFRIQSLVSEMWDRFDLHDGEIRLHPTDLKILQSHGADWVQQHLTGNNVRVSPDPTLRRGECRILAHDQQFLAGVEVELAHLREQLSEVL
jgi:flagellar biosynthesis/type III secretory pathway protein FliH